MKKCVKVFLAEDEVFLVESRAKAARTSRSDMLRTLILAGLRSDGAYIPVPSESLAIDTARRHRSIPEALPAPNGLNIEDIFPPSEEEGADVSDILEIIGSRETDIEEDV